MPASEYAARPASLFRTGVAERIHSFGAWQANFLITSNGKILYSGRPSDPNIFQGPADVAWEHTLMIP